MFSPGTPAFPEWMSVYDKLATCPVCTPLFTSWQLEMDNSLFSDLSTTASDVSTLQPIRDPDFLINLLILLVSSAMLLSQDTATKVTAFAQQSDKTYLQNTKQSLLNSVCSSSACCWWGCPGTCNPPSYQHIPWPKKDLGHAAILSGHQPSHWTYSYSEADDFSICFKVIQPLLNYVKHTKEIKEGAHHHAAYCLHGNSVCSL